MKKTPEKPKTPQLPKLPPLRKEASTVIVLAISAALFVAALFVAHSGEAKDTGSLFWAYGTETIDFDTATVNEIVSEDMSIDEATEGSYAGSQELAVTIDTGTYAGTQLTAYNSFGPISGHPVEVGDSVTLTIKTHADGDVTATVYELNRIPFLIGFLILFFIVVVLVGSLTGLQSLIGLAFTCVCLFAILIPLILKGAPTILTTFVMCAYISLVCFTILGGVHRKTVGAFLGTVAGTFLAMVFGLGAQFFGKINGLRLEDAEPLYQLAVYDGIPIDMEGLLVASIIICALGAVMDVAMSIASALEEIHAANPKLTQKELFKSGMNVGRDMAGTMTNTLILAFLGGELTLMIFLYARDLSFYHMFSTAFVALETIAGLSSSIGMILAIPLTALISSMLITRGGRR
ncbi:YibE/F-like protein [Slackia heliotrinireducens]|uniref:Predicted multitransmembrane protein n=1 Tax=Slackia heliotrinireducens (strain ATCC 29202 / DSM 20476 / NCTC 11029 / RHS 1) TaxID=471855 RepID=C7N7J6_SLAHD|nr:YibE/F family protein [Slackia heliotrinireducens]ACV22881.1 predicted multitransmembrane protein [Slackia heliotrinireducens DSM 20476]VEH01656.1 YibE/F-like protein [Slackia heliotrinireducens]